MTRKRIAIVGGGIGGLTLAAALDPARFTVTVHEAQPERAVTGSALGMWGPARRVLDRLGALPERGERATEGALRRIDGRRIVRVRGGGPMLVDRPALLGALEAAVPTSVQRVHQEVTEPAALEGDLVVGADGVRSRVRALVDPAAANRVRTPYLALRAIRDGRPDDAEFGEYWGGASLFGIAPISGERTYWFSAYRSELAEPLDLEEVLSEARARFRDATPVVRALVEQAGPSTLATRLWVTPPMRAYARDRFVVLGDAAHAMTPNLGRGACSAIVDAATLADALNRGADLRGWQARRVPATQAARLGSAVLMRLALAAP